MYAMLAIKLQFGGAEMKISELFSDVITEDLTYEYKAILNPDKPVKWAKLLLDMQMVKVELCL